jgi:L-threonylcarbamoyladenylate synthase
MTHSSDTFDDEIIRLLIEGGIGILRTDTLYGIVARADNERAVERIYDIKKRAPQKSPILLIASLDQLFDVYEPQILDRVNELWPGKTSIILPSNTAPRWLTRGNESLAYRIPDNEALREMLQKTGPLIAPSANPEGEQPAMDIHEAKGYFGDEVDFYVDHGRVFDDSPSALYRLKNPGWERLR